MRLEEKTDEKKRKQICEEVIKGATRTKGVGDVSQETPPEYNALT